MIKRNKAFALGFFSVLALFVAANYYSYVHMYDHCCLADGISEFGWPFALYQEGGFANAEGIVWSGLNVNVLIAAAASFISGRLCEKLAGKRTRFP